MTNHSGVRRRFHGVVLLLFVATFGVNVVQAQLMQTELLGEALSLHQSGQTEAAQDAYEALITHHPNWIAPRYHLARLLAQKQQWEPARDVLESALKAHPDAGVAFEALQALYHYEAARSYAQALGHDQPRIPAPTLDPNPQWSQAPAQGEGDTQTLAQVKEQLQQQRVQINELTERYNEALGRLRQQQQ